MTRSTTGWLFVAVQAVLLLAVVFLPAQNHWPTPFLVEASGLGLIALGLVVAAVAAVRLGGALRPSPVPAANGELQTVGFYRFVRHPIYTGVLAVVLGVTIRSGSLITAAVALITFGFFSIKAKWEEERLAEHYPGYEAYAAQTPRFIPLGTMRANPDT